MIIQAYRRYEPEILKSPVQAQPELRRHLAGCPEGVSLSPRRARTPAGQPPERRRY
ncbi:MAG: hypothetical protein ACLQBK_26105 [Candidatus Sulfotelmatobacter sp.]